MFDHNFWYWLLAGISHLLQPILARLPVHASEGMIGYLLAVVFYAVTPFMFWIGSFFDLRIFASVIGTIITLELVRAIIAVIRWVYSLIPAAA